MEIYKLKCQLKAILARAILMPKVYDPSDHILLFCSPRSGSTWLMDILKQIPRIATLWEPFHKEQGILSDYPQYGYRLTIPEKTSDDLVHSRLIKLFQGNLINSWLVKHSSLLDYLKSDHFLIKFVRAQSLIPWIMERYQFKNKPLILLRHPIPTALSQLKAFHSGGNVTPLNLKENTSYTEIYRKHEKFITKWSTSLEIQVTRWALHTHVGLEYVKRKNNCQILFYEDLIMSPKKELMKVFDAWNKGIPSTMEFKSAKRSTTDFKNDLKKDPKVQIEKWLPQITEVQKDHIQEILDYFNISHYSAYDPYPLEH